MENRKIIIKSPDLQKLEPVISEWFDLVEKHCKEFKDQDAPYWYNERASLSALAGAIWRKEGLVLEEFVSKKGGRTGRTDFWFRWDNTNYTIEAKYFFLSVSPGCRNFEKKLQDSLKDAENDVVSATLAGESQIALVFIAPYIPKTWESEVDIRISEFTSKFETLVSYEGDNIYGWLFPDSARTLKDKNGDKSINPGMAFVGKYLGIKKA